MGRLCCVLLCVLAFFNGAAQAAGLAVVDVDRIFRESAPGKAGETHLGQVRDILQKGLDELRGFYKGKEDTAEARAALRDGQAALEQQFAADHLAVRQVLSATLAKVILAWFAANAQGTAISAVAPASAFFAYNPALDVTDAVMQEMDKEKPAFHPLPTVSVQANPAAKPQADPQARPGPKANQAAKPSPKASPQARPQTPTPGKGAIPPARPSGQTRMP